MYWIYLVYVGPFKDYWISELKTVNMSEGEVLDEETNWLLENVPLETILGVEENETPALEMRLDAAIEPPTKERGGAMQAVASHQSTNGEGGRDRAEAWQWAPLPGAAHSNNECEWRETSYMLTTCMAMGWARSSTKYHIVHRSYNPGHHMIGTSIHTCSMRH